MASSKAILRNARAANEIIRKIHEKADQSAQAARFARRHTPILPWSAEPAKRIAPVSQTLEGHLSEQRAFFTAVAGTLPAQRLKDEEARVREASLQRRREQAARDKATAQKARDEEARVREASLQHHREQAARGKVAAQRLREEEDRARDASLQLVLEIAAQDKATAQKARDEEAQAREASLQRVLDIANQEEEAILAGEHNTAKTQDLEELISQMRTVNHIIIALAVTALAFLATLLAIL